MNAGGLVGWENLRHGGLLLDAQRQGQVAAREAEPLPFYLERDLRRLSGGVLEGNGDVPEFVTFVLTRICGYTDDTGSWWRGSKVSVDWGRKAITGETVKPRQLWRGHGGGILPVFIEKDKRIGVGRGRRSTSRVLQWLRAGGEKLALLTNGRQWRLIFAGLDFDAWCEWDLDLWLEEGQLSPQVSALRTLFLPEQWIPSAPDEPFPLLQAILDSRKGQAELSAVLGERVREAVELLLQAHGEVLNEACADIDPTEIYRAAVRVVMRMAVILFAESRELLPRDNALYHGSYGLTGLLEELEKVAARGGNRLAHSYNAWPRMLALFRLVYVGSHHPELLVPAYGGELFAVGDPESVDPMARVIAVFESACYERELFPDRMVYRILERITRTKVKVRQGRSSTWITAPVDFSDLSSEYIGILYEGLLDFELKTAPEGDPVIFLAVGNQPALPLSRLEAMDDRALANLFETLKDTSSSEEETKDAEPEEELEAEEIEGEDEAEEDEEELEESEEEVDGEDARHVTRTRGEAWARHAVEVAKLVSKPRGSMTPEKRLAHEEAIARKARQLVTRVVLPGEWYLVRWGGTRKGAGTFYTRPGLAVPTVQRTLRPLAYDPPLGKDGEPDRDAPPLFWTPRKPEEILALKVCDPACGSGSFPVAALRFLTEALYQSLHHHGRIEEQGQHSMVALLYGPDEERGLLAEEQLPCRPDDEVFEPHLKAVLRRHVVERCIYGVDLDPLAVELCRLALWVETMDRDLPFSFLDHKIKCGNSLVGAWFDQFQHYPVMAWKNREGGDTNHNNGVHFKKGERTKSIKAFVKDVLTPDLRHAIEGRTLFDTKEIHKDAHETHRAALETLARLHDMPVQDTAERARMYRDELLGSDAYRQLKEAMNLWCACWFWPADEIEHAPLPSNFHSPTFDNRKISQKITSKHRFFHWELEFPDVYHEEGSGFDAIMGNPPWDIAKPNSKEYFSNIDPLYRSYGKQEALRYQTSYFSNKETEDTWLAYNADFRAQSNVVNYSSDPFGDIELHANSTDRFAIARGNANKNLHFVWREHRKQSYGFADTEHPFLYQGSADINLYKLFLEQSHALLRNGGRLGFVVPSGLYSDHGTGDLRHLFLERSRWEWLFGFENRQGIFDIHRSYKFNPVIIEKGGRTDAIYTAFMHRKLEDWECGEAYATSYPIAQVKQFSPHSKAILEIQSSRDIEILEKVYANSDLLGDESPDGWGIEYTREFDMTNDSMLFPPRPKWEAQRYQPDEYSRWLKEDWHPIDELWVELGTKPLPEGERRNAQPPYDRLPIPRADIPEGIILSREADKWIRESAIEDTALPLFEGRMIGHYDFSEKGWVSGKGRSAVWRNIPWERKIIDPQFLMRRFDYQNTTDRQGNAKALRGLKPGFMAVGSATNQRSMIAGIINDMPCGNAVPPLLPKQSQMAVVLGMLLNSFAFDYVMRNRLVGLNLNYFVIEETPLPRPTAISIEELTDLSARVLIGNHVFADQWIKFPSGSTTWRSKWGITDFERLRLKVNCDAVSFSLLNYDRQSVEYLLGDCALNISQLSGEGSKNLNPKGFWRVDKDKDPELRHTVLTLVAFHELQQMIESCGGDRKEGIKAFCDQNNGEGWMLPETLRLDDYGLGHDGHAKQHQPVASRLGPRFYAWQLAQDPEESWRECHLHARNLLGEEGYQQLLEEIEAEKRGETLEPSQHSKWKSDGDLEAQPKLL